MSALATPQTRKRPVNLSLNEKLVEQVRGISGNLSAVVERLLTDYVAYESAQAATRQQAFKQNIQAWNEFALHCGSYADEHSTL